MNLRTNKIIEKAEKDGWRIIFDAPYAGDFYRLCLWTPFGVKRFEKIVENANEIPDEVIEILLKDYNMNNEINYKLIAERLWAILDDIDTAFDHYKPDMKDRFVNYVSEKSKERSLYANSLDGQTLTFNEDIPTIEDLDPMCKWFKDAWRIEKELKNKPEVDMPKIPVTEEENIEVKLPYTTDAQVWTDDFFKTFGKVYPDIFYYINSLLPKDGCESFKEWVFGWFCNAIQTGIDLTNNERDKQYIYILQSNSGDIVDIYNYEPSEQDINSSYKLRFNFPTGTPVDASKKCLLIRYNKHKGMQIWNGKAEPETKYNWKNI